MPSAEGWSEMCSPASPFEIPRALSTCCWVTIARPSTNFLNRLAISGRSVATLSRIVFRLCKVCVSCAHSLSDSSNAVLVLTVPLPTLRAVIM